ncbi:MAG: hypothetical protein ACI9CO_001369 [Candidatus Azotimanducaceae bacterium]|jgi:hypothetical protein
MSAISRGKCACGKVEFQYEGQAINAVFCYCSECQLHTGSDKFFGVRVANDKFKLTKGSPEKYTRIGDSHKNVNYCFCKHCGTNLFSEVTFADIVSTSASTLINNDELKPNMVIYTSSAPSWAVFPKGVPRFDKNPPIEALQGWKN